MKHSALFVFSALAFLGTAHAGEEDASFRSPSGNILCSSYVSESEGQLVRCDIIQRNSKDSVLPMPSDCDLDWGNMFYVGKTGKANLMCAGDLAANPDSPILEYGDVIRKYGITCMSSEAGFTCLNGEGHGFALSKAKQELF